MTPKLSAEILEALQQHPGQPLRVFDDQSQKAFLVVPEEALPTLWDEYLRHELQKGLVALEQGEVAEWDVEATLAEAERRAALRNS